jgi:dynein heavy chain, axonemal
LIDNKLQVALNTATWSDYKQIYIDDLHADIKNLHTRTMKTKENVEKIITSLKVWGSLPMYIRHDGINTNLMQPEDFILMIYKRQQDCKASKRLIDEVMDENFRLFFNLPLRPTENLPETPPRRTKLGSIDTLKSIDENKPSEVNAAKNDKSAQASESSITLRSVATPSTSRSTFTDSIADLIKSAEQVALFRPYEEHIDRVIWREVEESVRVSVKYIKFEMENRLEHNAPIFEVNLELQPPKIVFIPEMDTSLANARGMMKIVKDMVGNILNITEMIPLVAQPEMPRENGELETFAVYLDTSTRASKGASEIEEMNMDIISLVSLNFSNFLSQIEIFLS